MLIRKPERYVNLKEIPIIQRVAEEIVPKVLQQSTKLRILTGFYIQCVELANGVQVNGKEYLGTWFSTKLLLKLEKLL